MVTRSITRSALLTAMATAAVLLAPAPPASAHTELTSTDPAPGASLAEPPNEVTLAFTDKMSADFSSLSLTVGDREAVTLTPDTDGNEVSAVIPAVLPGTSASPAVVTWKIAYRVVSADGHPVAGELSFEAPAPSPTEPTGTAQPQSSLGQPTDSSTEQSRQPSEINDESSGAGPGLTLALVGIGAVSLGVLMAGILRRRRPKDRSPDA
ncbi:copper resistance protein CopC [Aeromicrobium sp.]|uniref:copper resistance CopC family protein n=1 Tax=Aeromicrobium sp. TaxID=1871063 RepID=UPI0028AA4D28|nr:copper resistance protein CopC [Aeromicrobium sp.]